MTTTTIDEPALQLSPRVALRPGDHFRVRRGSGPVWCGGRPGPVAVGAPAGEYVLLRLFRSPARPKRLYADAIHLPTGCTHTLYLAGPQHRSKALSTITNRPHRVQRCRRKPR